ncbi:unnamed protein product [Choristocarpus tenellus]
MVQGNVVPPASFGPMSHALCRLAAGEHRTVVSYAARGIKNLVLDDSLRAQAALAGIPAVLVEALRNWEEEVPCLREVLAALQTLCGDKATVMAVVDAGLVGPLTELLDAPDLELRLLATATASNTLAFSDTLLLAKEACIDTFSEAMPELLDSVKSNDSTLRRYAIAAVSNACAHPVLAARAEELGAVDVMREVVKSSRPSSFVMSIMGTGVSSAADCAGTALLRLTGSEEGDLEEVGAGGGGSQQRPRHHIFKWGAPPTVRLFVNSRTSRVKLGLFVVVWMCFVYRFLYV